MPDDQDQFIRERAWDLAGEYVDLEWELHGEPVRFRSIVEYVIANEPSVDALEFITDTAYYYEDDDRVHITAHDKVDMIVEVCANLIEQGKFEELVAEERGNLWPDTINTLRDLAQERIFVREENKKNMRGFLFHGELKQNPKLCPRCRGLIPNAKTPGAFPGAMSRYLVPVDGEFERIIEICSACGEDEAWMQVHEQGRIIPPHEWPVERVYATDADIERRAQAFAELEAFKASEEGQAIMEEWSGDGEA